MQKVFTLAVLSILFKANAQTFTVPSSGSSSISTCSGTVYDPGGTSNYSNSQNGYLTITPSIPGNYVQLSFSQFSTESCCDILSIYDGTNSSAPRIGQYNGSSSPGVVTATNPNGALTLYFYTDGSVTAQGFAASISCLTSIPASDLTILNPSLGNSVSAPNLTVSASCTVRNSSSTMVTSSTVGYYFSTDTLLDDGDSFITFSSGGSLAGFGSATRSASLLIPGSTPLGDYFILFVADYNNVIAEDDEGNNVKWRPITISVAAPDLIINSASLTNTISYPSGSTNFSCSLHNQGLTAASSPALGVYLSTDSLLDQGDTLLTTVSGGNLSSLGSSTRSGTLTIPSNTAYGNYFVLFVADPANLVTEVLENNNVAARAIRITHARPDLNPFNPVLNQTVVSQGTSISGSVQLRNNGGVAVPAGSLGLFLSADSVYSVNDILLTTLSLNPLSPGAANTTSFSAVLIPNTVPLGHYYLLYYADYLDIFNEISETNNLVFRELDVIPPAIDLTIRAQTVTPLSVSPGSNLGVSCYIHNIGTSNSPGSTVGYYLSNDSIYDAGDTYLNFSSGGTLNYGSSSIRSATLTVPAQASLGTWYIIYYADYQNHINEWSEANNFAVRQIEIVAPFIDFQVSGPAFVPSTIAAGGNASAACSVYNYGNAPFSGSSRLGIFVSTNNTFDSNDMLIDSISYSGISAGSNTYLSKTVTIPASLAPGTYHLLYYADFRQTTVESVEDNNIASRQFTIVAPFVDLAITNASASPASDIAPGSTTNAGMRVQNYGNTISTAGKVGVYLSVNNTFDGSDVLLDSIAFNAIAAGNYITVSKSITIPSATAVGNYYLVFFADHQFAIDESNENNNVSSYSISVVAPNPDLRPEAFSVSSGSVAPGASTTVNGYIYNYGNTTAPAGNTGFYLSTNTTYDASDVLLGTAVFNSIPAGGSAFYTQSLTIPVNTPGGSYFIIAYADHMQVIPESNENNNTAYASISVNAPYVDLRVTSGNISPGTVQGGGTISTTCTVYNYGNSPSGTGSVGYYLSQNSSYDQSDMLLDSAAFASVAGGGSQPVTKSIIVPGNLASGYYYIIFYVDFNGQITENSETNNYSYKTFYVTGPAPNPDLQINNLSIVQTTAAADSEIDFSFTAINTGGQSSPEAEVALFLSQNEIFDNTDILIYSTNINSLAPSSALNLQGRVRIPATIAEGQYYLLFYFDYQNVIEEVNEDNNMATAAIEITNATGLSEPGDINGVMLFPNPAAGYLNISFSSEVGKQLDLRLLSASGKLMREDKLITAGGKNLKTIDIRDLPNGVYLVTLTNHTLRLPTCRIVVNR